MARVTPVWWLRHGESWANVTGRLSHRAGDGGLTPQGVEQARAAEPRVDAGVAAVFSSPLPRAVATAEIVAASRGLPVEVLEDLRELDVGDLDGRTDREAWDLHDEVVAAWGRGVRDAAFPGGEDAAGVAVRLVRALGHVAARGPALVVAHSGLLRWGMCGLYGPGVVPPEKLRNCGLAELAVAGPLEGAVTDVRIVSWEACHEPSTSARTASKEVACHRS